MFAKSAPLGADRSRVMASNTHSLSKRGRLFAWLGLSVEHLTISRALRAQALWRRNSTLARVYVNLCHAPKQ